MFSDTSNLVKLKIILPSYNNKYDYRDMFKNHNPSLILTTTESCRGWLIENKETLGLTIPDNNIIVEN